MFCNGITFSTILTIVRSTRQQDGSDVAGSSGAFSSPDGIDGGMQVTDAHKTNHLVGCAGHLRSATLMAFRQRHVAHTEA